MFQFKPNGDKVRVLVAELIADCILSKTGRSSSNRRWLSSRFECYDNVGRFERV